MMKKILSILLVVLTLCSTMTLFASAEYNWYEMQIAYQELQKKYPSYANWVTVGGTSNTKVNCSKEGCTANYYTNQMFLCYGCGGKYWCADHVVDHMSDVHKFMAMECCNKGCMSDSQILYCGYCRQYVCTDHYVGSGHMAGYCVPYGGNVSPYNCPTCKTPLSLCNECSLLYCTKCNPQHELSHIFGGSTQYECAIGGCTKNQKLTFCSRCSRWFCSNHYVSEGHSTHNYDQSYGQYCTKHYTYYVLCTRCGVSYCPQCTNHFCANTAKCKTHGTNLAQCKDCGVSYCIYCSNHICTGKALCSYHNRPHEVCYFCGVQYCAACTSHTCYGYNNLTCPQHPTTYYVTCSLCGYSYCPKCDNHVCTNYFQQCPTHKVYLTQCNRCNQLYCVYCDNHFCYGTNPSSYCVLHGIFHTYCRTCDRYYCPKCDANHQCNYYSSIYYPRASVVSGNVLEGTKVSFTTNSNYTLYYTTDGSIPTAKSTEYTRPIEIKETTTIRIIGIHDRTYAQTPVMTYTYTVVSDIKFTDTAAIKGLNDALTDLVGKGVFENGTKFNPEAGITYAELMDAFEKLGIDTDKVKLEKKYYTVDGHMTYQEFSYVTYKVLLTEKVIGNAKNGSKTLKTLEYSELVPKVSLIRASLASLIEHDLCYRLDFKPEDKCTRAFMAMALGEVYNILYED